MQAVISPVIQDGVTYYRYDMMPVEPRRLR